MTRCGRLTRRHNFTSESDQLQLQWSSDAWREYKGFWIHVEALGQLRVSCRSNKTPQDDVIQTTQTQDTDDVTTPATTEETQQKTSTTLTELRERFPGLTTQQLRRMLLRNVTSQTPQNLENQEQEEIERTKKLDREQDFKVNQTKGGLKE